MEGTDMTGSCPVLHPADSVPIPLLRLMSPVGCQSHVVRDELAHSLLWTLRTWQCFKTDKRKRDLLEWLRPFFQTGYVKANTLSLIWLNLIEMSLDLFGHSHKQPPPTVFFHKLILMLFKHSNQLPFLNTIVFYRQVMENVVSPLQTVYTQWLVLSQNETHCSTVLHRVNK